MAVQYYIALMFLFLALEAEVLKAQGKNDCQRLDKLDYCRNSSRIRVTKDKNDYRIRLCSNDQCMSDAVGDMNLRIRCSDVCDVCKSLPGQNDCKENGNCEEQVDKFFDDYCLSTNMTTRTFEQLAGSQNCTPSGTSKVGGQVSPQSITQTTGCDTSGSESAIVAVLGALLGLSMVLLAVATTGWVCTCVSIKKRREKLDSEVIESTDSQNRMASESMRKSKKDEDTDDDNEERYFKNPTYEGTSNKNGVPSATYETVNLSDSTKITIENEQAYAVPDKQWQVDGTYIF